MSMRFLKYDFSRALAPEPEIEKSISALAPVRKKLLSAAQDTEYSTPLSFMHAPLDTQTINAVQTCAEQARALNPACIFLIGIGGSNLGACAVQRLLDGHVPEALSCMQSDKPHLYCVDTIDTRMLTNMLETAEKVLSTGREICVIIASKSGTTLETLVNASFFIELLKKQRRDYARFITVITEKKSSLAVYAEQNNIPCIDVPENIGGRYSVFTATGLFPLAVLGIDINEFCSGADISLFDSAARSAAVMYYYLKNHVTNYNIFLASPRFTDLGLWYRQLIGESLGKRCDLSGKRVETGLTPLISVATTDLHSVGQLYLGGPRDKLTVFIGGEESTMHELKLEHPVGLLPEHIERKTVGEIKRAIDEGVRAAYAHDKRPYVTIDLSPLTPASIGAFMYARMIEIVCLGFLMQVNPFDQPQVEEYKSQTRTILNAR